MNGLTVVATTGDPAFAVDEYGKIIAWNPGAEQHLGYSAREVLGRRCWEVLRGCDVFTNRYCGKHCPIREMANAGEPVCRSQMYLRAANGAYTRMNVSILIVSAHGPDQKEIVHLIEPLPDKTLEQASFGDTVPISNANNARLTGRQLDVLRRLAAGKTTRQVGEELGISPSTVRHHIQQILERLKVHNRMHAVSLAHRLSLI